jgi:hypothetical protein
MEHHPGQWGALTGTSTVEQSRNNYIALLKRKLRRKDERDIGPLTIPTKPSGRSAIQNSLNYTPIFQASTRRILRYHEEELSFSSSSGIPTEYFFSANGCFDPNISGSGHQPIGFDQMMLFYNTYTVISSKISLEILNSNNTALSRAVLYLSPDTVQITDANRIIENGLCRTKLLYPNVTWNSAACLNLDCNIQSYFGRTNDLRQLLQDGSLAGDAANNPPEQVYFAVGAWDPFGTNSLSYFFNVTIEYDVVFWEPRKLIES